jgi:hypothetical protein
MSDNYLEVWHGSRRWSGQPEIRPTKKGQYEHGPGIYSTTNLNTATKYAKGGGRILKFKLDPEMKWIEESYLPIDDVLAFIKGAHGLGKRAVLEKDLIRYCDKEKPKETGLIWAPVIVNLAVNNECLGGASGPVLAQFLASQNIHASRYRRSQNDDWVIIFDPAVIENVEVLSSSQIDWQRDALLPIEDQLEELNQSRNKKPAQGFKP